jgi:hypothetical protein
MNEQNMEPVANRSSNNEKISRRDFLTWIGKKATMLALLGSTAAVAGADNVTRESTETVTLNLDDTQSKDNKSPELYKIIKPNTYLKTPYSHDEKVFDITTRQFISHPTTESILLSNQDFFENRQYLSYRALHPTPEFLKENATFNGILNRAQELKLQLNQRLGGQFSEFHTPQAILTAIREHLKYNNQLASSKTFDSFTDRINNGATDCEEFAAITSYALAAMGIKSDVLAYAFGDGLVAKSHICNVINIGGTCCVVDTTYSNKIQTLEDYLTERNTSLRNNELFIDSVFPDQPLPWNDVKWIIGNKQIITLGSNTVANCLNTESQFNTGKNI